MKREKVHWQAYALLDTIMMGMFAKLANLLALSAKVGKENVTDAEMGTI